jgi:hypothetical protein
MLEVLLAIVALLTVMFAGFFIALMREYGYTVRETFVCVLEAIQDIKAYKLRNHRRGS